MCYEGEDDMKVWAVSRTIITCFKDGFSFLQKDMKMGPKGNPSMAMASLYKLYYNFSHVA